MDDKKMINSIDVNLTHKFHKLLCLCHSFSSLIKLRVRSLDAAANAFLLSVLRKVSIAETFPLLLSTMFRADDLTDPSNLLLVVISSRGGPCI